MQSFQQGAQWGGRTFYKITQVFKCRLRRELQTPQNPLEVLFKGRLGWAGLHLLASHKVGLGGAQEFAFEQVPGQGKK